MDHFDNIREENAKKAIIEKFNLTSNSVKEIDVEFEDSKENREFFIRIIDSIIEFADGEENYCCLKFHAQINGKTYELLINETILTTQYLLDILEKFGCKFYLHLDDTEKLILYIKTSDNEVLHEEEITKYELIFSCLIPKE